MARIFLRQQLAIASCVTCAAFGCKANDNAQTKSGTIANPDAAPTACDVTLSKDAPYTAQELKEALTAALNNAALSKVYNEEPFRDMLFASDVPSVLEGALTPNFLGLSDCSLTRFINESITKPSYFFWLTGNGKQTNGGMTLYKGDVFAEGFYRCRAAGVEQQIFARRKYNHVELMTQQPWLEWDRSARKFLPQKGSPAKRLLQHISQDQGSDFLTLHRGTDVTFSKKETILANRNTFAFENYGGIFTTPSFEAAKGWANPVVISAKLNSNVFLSAATLPNPTRGGVPTIYVGIEYGYPEIAFLFAPGDKNNLFMDAISAKCVTNEAKGEDIKFAPLCK
jgi:hypothetical protein